MQLASVFIVGLQGPSGTAQAGEPGTLKGKFTFLAILPSKARHELCQEGLCQLPFCRINVGASIRKDKVKSWHQRSSRD